MKHYIIIAYAITFCLNQLVWATTAKIQANDGSDHYATLRDNHVYFGTSLHDFVYGMISRDTRMGSSNATNDSGRNTTSGNGTFATNTDHGLTAGNYAVKDAQNYCWILTYDPTIDSAGAYTNVVEASYTGYPHFVNACANVSTPEPDNHPTNFSAIVNSGTQITTSWTDSTGIHLPDGYLLLCSSSATFTDPVDGIVQADDTNCSDGKGVKNIIHGRGSNYTWKVFIAKYYFKVYPYSNSGTSIDYKTNGVVPTANASTDVIAPVITVPASDITTIVATKVSIPVRVTYTVSANDDVDGVITPVCIPASGSSFSFGTTRVTCTATDAAGNEDNETFTVSVDMQIQATDGTNHYAIIRDDHAYFGTLINNRIYGMVSSDTRSSPSGATNDSGKNTTEGDGTFSSNTPHLSERGDYAIKDAEDYCWILTYDPSAGSSGSEGAYTNVVEATDTKYADKCVNVIPSDSDNDGVIDDNDNCINISNSNQADADNDGIGNACEADTDEDGVIDDNDNCINISNSNQADADNDGIGNACEVDTDNDGIIDDSDNCPFISNVNQEDIDNDGIGILCDNEGEPSPVYRFWSQLNKAHFFTISENEKDYIIATYPEEKWKYGNVAYYAYKADSAPTDASPVYRFWSNTNKAHFFTISESEKDYIIATYPEEKWKYGGIAWYAYKTGSAPQGTSPVYRFWSSTNKTHFFTSSELEKDYIIATYPEEKWKYGGIAWYAYK